MKFTKYILAVGAAAAICTTGAFAGGNATWNSALGRWEYRDAYGQSEGTGTYNGALGRYEFRNPYGVSTGSATWNSALGRWEFRNAYGQ